MRKISIIPALVLSAMTLGVVVHAMPASAHPAIVAGEDDDGDDAVQETFSGSSATVSAGAGAPSGGAATGFGGMSTSNPGSATPFLLTGAAGLGLLGASAASRRLRTVKA